MEDDLQRDGAPGGYMQGTIDDPLPAPVNLGTDLVAFNGERKRGQEPFA